MNYQSTKLKTEVRDKYFFVSLAKIKNYQSNLVKVGKWPPLHYCYMTPSALFLHPQAGSLKETKRGVHF